MSRNTDLSQILFPVKLADLYLEKGVAVPKYKALINCETGDLFTIVSENYRLISNQEAIELGKQCFKLLFDTVDLKDFEIFNIITPKTKSFCHIDIVHRKYAVNVWKAEVWLPYIRITNSYNKTKALRFDLGFCRELCNNGVIFEKKTLKVQYYHTKQHLVLKDGSFDVTFTRLQKLQNEFLEYMNNLKRYHVPEEYVLPAICKALNIDFDLMAENPKTREKQHELFREFTSKGRVLIKSYYNEMGPTAYTLLNIISDIASKPIVRMGPGIMIDSYQKRTGTWVKDFINEIEKKSFDFKSYLGQYITLFS